MKVYLQRDDSLSALTVAISCCFLVLFASGYETDRKKCLMSAKAIFG